MPSQSALTIAAEVRPEATEDLRRLLASMGDGVANGSVIDLGAPEAVHFARLVLVDAATDLRGAPLPAWLVYMADVDVPKQQHLVELVDEAGDGIDRLFGHCVNYPSAPATPEQRADYLRACVVKEQARYVNWVGRGERQIRDEARLRERIEAYLDEHADELDGRDAGEVARELRRFVETDESLAWARRPAEGLPVGFRLRELVHAVAIPLLVLLLLPLILLGLPIFVVLLRVHERRDPAPHVKPPPELTERLAALEDHVVLNPFTAIGLVKTGLFRRLTLSTVLFAIDYVTRHVFNRGDLAGVKTIHFARWAFLDGKRRMIFASNYDGSLESYMDDFIDKIAWGLNIVFSNGYGFPRARFLILDGARDELAFKDYLRLHQVPTHVWHSAYGRLTALNITNNARIRAGLQRDAGEADTVEWLRAL